MKILPAASRSTKSVSGVPSKAPSSLSPSATSFDFLDGAFRADERARTRGLLALAASGLAMVAMLLGGVVLSSQNSSTLQQLQTQSQQASRLSVELGQLSNTGGIGEQELAGRLQVLRGQLDRAELDQVHALTVINDLRVRAPVGAQITSVELKRSDASVQQLTVQVALESFSRLTELSEGFSTIWYLSDVSVSWTSGSDRVAVTFKAIIDPDLAAGPVVQLLEQLASVQSAAQDAPAGQEGD